MLRSLGQLGGGWLRKAASAPAGLGQHQTRSMSIHRMTRLTVADNSGAKELQCIGHVRKREPGVLGDVIRAVVKTASPDAKARAPYARSNSSRTRVPSLVGPRRSQTSSQLDAVRPESFETERVPCLFCDRSRGRRSCAR